MKKIIGIDLGGTSIKLAIVSQEGEILENGRLKPIYWRMVKPLSQTLFSPLGNI